VTHSLNDLFIHSLSQVQRHTLERRGTDDKIRKKSLT